MNKNNKNIHNRYEKKKERKMSTNSRKCPYCVNGEMRCRGASDSAGGISWKCKNKQCGRTKWERKYVRAPKPLVPHSYV